MRRGLQVLLVFLALPVSSQTPEQSRAIERDVANRIAAFSNLLNPDNARGLSEAQWADVRKKTTAAIRAEVGTFIETHVQPSEQCAEIETTPGPSCQPAYQCSNIVTHRRLGPPISGSVDLSLS